MGAMGRGRRWGSGFQGFLRYAGAKTMSFRIHDHLIPHEPGQATDRWVPRKGGRVIPLPAMTSFTPGRGCYTPGMALPAPKLDPQSDSSPRFPREVAEGPHGAVFRPVEKPNGELIIEQLPLTLDVLLDPRIGDEMTQNRPHERFLGPLADMLERFLERQDGVAVFSDLLIRWKQLGERDVSPDLYVVKGVRDREAIEDSFDPVAEGVSPCLVFEVVSQSTRSVKAKDEEENPPLFAKMGVEDLVLLYPPRPARKKKERKLRLDAKRLDATGRYRTNRPGPSGWILLDSVGLRLKVAEDGLRLLVEDVKTGERLLTSVEEEAARRQAEEARQKEAEARQAAEARVEQETEARQAAEKSVERGLRQSVEDLCTVLGLAWDAEKSAQVKRLSASQLETLRQHLVQEKSWPESFPDVP